MPRIRLLCALLAIVAGSGDAASAAVPAPIPSPPVARDAVAAHSAQALRSWATLTGADGAVRDVLEPALGRFNYGTLMLAQAQLRAAARTGEDRLGDAAVAQVRGTIARNGPQDPFYLLGAAVMLREGQLGAYRARDWERIARPLAEWLGRFEPYTGHDFTNPTHYSNWKLVWGVGAMALMDAGVAPATETAIAADPRGLRREVRRIVSTLAVRSAGPRARRNGRPTMRPLSDRRLFPNAYHVFSAYLLERIHADHPEAFSRDARRLRREVSRYTLSLMAPDGQLTHAGRSLEQSWVLAAAAAYGARRASLGGRDAGAYRALADRAVSRLVRVHGRLPDGTIPVVPGLRTRWDRAIMDGYASMTQYNGLTLMMLEDAVAHWPDTVVGGRLPADRALLVSDLRGSGLAWGAARDVWWAVGGRWTRGDGRYEQGLASVKVRTAAGWQDLLAARPIAGEPRSAWTLATRRGPARLRLVRARGSGRRARLSGAWYLRDTGRRLRPAAVEIRVHGARLEVLTRLRRGERLTAPLWTAGRPSTLQPGAGIAAAGTCTVTASGTGCPVTVEWQGPGLTRLMLLPPDAAPSG